VVTGHPAGDTPEGEERWEEARQGSWAHDNQGTYGTPAAGATRGTTVTTGGPVTTGTDYDVGGVSNAWARRGCEFKLGVVHQLQPLCCS
jgi:hypothetical protein